VGEAVEENADGGSTPVELTGEELFAFVKQVVDHQVKDALKDIHQRLADLEMLGGDFSGAQWEVHGAIGGRIPGPVGSVPTSSANVDHDLEGVPWYTG
jgi:hypothetical protein